MKLLTRERERRTRRDEAERFAVRARLQRALHELLPGEVCWVYGSLTRPGRFHEWSDVDVALEHDPAAGTLYGLMSKLSERLGRHVDVVLLDETRLREKILREGERWIG